MMKESNLKEGMEQCINLLTLRLLPFWVSFEFFSFLFLAEWLSFYSIGLFPTHLYLLFCCQILPCVPNDDGSGCLPPPPTISIFLVQIKTRFINRSTERTCFTYIHTYHVKMRSAVPLDVLPRPGDPQPQSICPDETGGSRSGLLANVLLCAGSSPPWRRLWQRGETDVSSHLFSEVGRCL